MPGYSYLYKSILPAAAFALIMLLQSCMKDKPEALPENLEWNPQLALPLGQEEFGMNSESGFDTTLLEPDTLSGVPAWTGEDQVTMEGYFAFDLSTISSNVDKLNAILFRVNCSNDFPHTMYSQAYFLDGNSTPLDSMFREGPVETPAARVDDQGGSIDPGQAQHDAIIEGERIAALGNARNILFRSAFLVNDLDSTLIPAYPDFRLRLDAGLMLDLSFDY